MNTRFKLITAGDWLRAAWPFTLVAGGGALWFGKDILHSIENTPHPALVYVILGALAAAVALAWSTLHQLIVEERAARAWRDLPPAQAVSREDLTPRASPFRDAYALVADHAGHPREANRQELERRLQAAETAYAERLSLPGFIAGALVGLGLVGTFIGLLGALDDLAKLFSGMSTASGGDPAALFGSMLLKLQAPMKSMGTAFIASLYGLLGSLVLGLTLVAVNHTRLRVNATVHDAIFDTFAGIPLTPSATIGAPSVPGAAAERLETALLSLTVKLEEQAAALAGLRHPQLWLDAWSQMNDQLGRLREQWAATSQASLALLREQARHAERTAEASAAMQALVTHAAARDSHEEVDLRQALQECRQVFEQASGRLRSILALQVDQCDRFETGIVATDMQAANTASASAPAPRAR